MEGKVVLEKNYRVDFLSMKWGIKNAETDRIVGRIRLNDPPKDVGKVKISLTFDVFSMEAETNSSPPNAEGVVTHTLKPKKVDVLNLSFKLDEFGFKREHNCVEGNFCYDFQKHPDWHRMFLSDVRVKGEPVTYQTTFNISADLNRSLFSLSKPEREESDNHVSGKKRRK